MSLDVRDLCGPVQVDERLVVGEQLDDLVGPRHRRIAGDGSADRIDHRGDVGDRTDRIRDRRVDRPDLTEVGAVDHLADVVDDLAGIEHRAAARLHVHVDRAVAHRATEAQELRRVLQSDAQVPSRAETGQAELGQIGALDAVEEEQRAARLHAAGHRAEAQPPAIPHALRNDVAALRVDQPSDLIEVQPARFAAIGSGDLEDGALADH